ncbi:PREDICTED: tumor necrosis factor ligand superfamily member 4 [Miniopterus natalensis]|uniref:tumor necrosis factor ligand superfamily member 4 n=1 Tax=Miniopterus natalensis TaxID=291302 RepID=UPI0007A6F2AA|nr:PREDICTED: tumor necrosis factor ligand superfamily member 4 [Miniopterus natalensis]
MLLGLHPLLGRGEASSPSDFLSCLQTVKMEGGQALGERVRNTPGLRFPANKLLLVASVVQGLGLLLCLTYICLHFYAPQVPPQYPPIQSIRAQFTRCDNEKGFILTSPSKEETMKVQDNSIPITCDGFYLISLKGFFSQELSLGLHYRKNRQPLFNLSKVTFVDSITVAFLGFKDKVYLNVTTHNTSCADIQVNGGELILIHQNPDGFCAE